MKIMPLGVERGSNFDVFLPMILKNTIKKTVIINDDFKLVMMINFFIQRKGVERE